MAKLIVLALAFTALVAFASAQKTIITTTIEPEGGQSQQCSQKLRGEHLNQCQKYLQQQGWSSIFGGDNPQMCCNELQNIDQQCQCEAVQEAFSRATHSQGGGIFGTSRVQQVRQKAQNLPNKCNLRIQQCRIPATITTTTTTIIDDDVTDQIRGSQQCQHVRQQSFNQCQRYIQQQIGSQGPLLMSINQQQPQGLQRQCCNELERVEQQCQCDAMQEVYRRAQQQQQQQGGSRRGGQQTMQDLQQVVQQLRNQCDIQVQQCRIPSAVF